MPERELSEDELRAVEDAATERDVSDDELAAIERAAAAPSPANAQPPRPAGPLPDPGFLSTVGHNLLAGAFKQGSDEASARLGTAFTPVLPGARFNLPSGDQREIADKGDLYRAARDVERQKLAGAQEHRPVTSFLANMAGDIGSDMALSALGVPVASTAYQVASGALTGFLGNDADLSEGRATPGNAASAALSTGIGAGLGFGVPKLGPLAAKYLPYFGAKARQGLEHLAVGQGRRALINGADSLSNRPPTSAPAVLEALRSGAIRMFGTTRGAAKRLEDLAEQRGAAYGAILDGLERAGVRGPEADVLAQKLTQEAEAAARVSGADDSVARLYTREAEAVSGKPDPGFVMPDTGATGARLTTLGLRQADEIKRNLQAQAKYGRYDETLLNEAKRKVASIFRQGVEDTVDEAGRAAPPNSEVAQLAEEFVPIKRLLANTKEAEAAAMRGAMRGANRSAIGLPDYIMAAGQEGGAAEKGLTALLLSQLRQRGVSTIAKGSYLGSMAAGAATRAMVNNPATTQAAAREALSAGSRQATRSDWLQHLVTTAPQALGEYGGVLSAAASKGPGALAVQDYVLTQSDPNYRQKKAEAQKGLEQQ